MRKNRFLLRYLQNMRPKKSSENTKRNRQKSVALYFTYISIASKTGQKWPKIAPKRAARGGSNGPSGGSYIKEGGSYIKELPSCIKEQPSCIKEEIKKAGYLTSPAFNDKRVVMFDSSKIQKVYQTRNTLLH